MTLHLNLPGSHHRSAEQQQELREARRLLRERIRDDWEYPTLPAWTSSGRKGSATEDVEDRIAGFRFHAPHHHHTRGVAGSESVGVAALGLTFEPMEWREREYSDIDDDTPVEEDDIADARSKDEEYRFEGPDSVGAQLSDRRQARKRKRHQALQQEMEWNDGLAHWMRRRDNWCSARLTTEVRLLESTGTDHDEAESTASESPRTSTSSAETDDNNSTPGSSPSVSPDLSASRTKAPATTTATTNPRIVPLEVLVPIAPPLLPNHPIRKRITSHMYPEIYAKIILQSRTPSIPINLLTLIHALVQGWKDDGEWPPKPGPIEKSIGRKKGSGHEGGLRQGVKAVGRVLRLTGTSEHGSSHRSRDEG